MRISICHRVRTLFRWSLNSRRERSKDMAMQDVLSRFTNLQQTIHVGFTKLIPSDSCAHSSPSTCLRIYSFKDWRSLGRSRSSRECTLHPFPHSLRVCHATCGSLFRCSLPLLYSRIQNRSDMNEMSCFPAKRILFVSCCFSFVLSLKSSVGASSRLKTGSS